LVQLLLPIVAIGLFPLVWDVALLGVLGFAVMGYSNRLCWP